MATLEFALPVQDARLLLRRRAIAGGRVGPRARPVPETVAFHAPDPRRPDPRGSGAGSPFDAPDRTETVIEEADGVRRRRTTAILRGFERAARVAGAADAPLPPDPPSGDGPRAVFAGMLHRRAVAVPPPPPPGDAVATDAPAAMPAPVPVVRLALRVGAIRTAANEWPCARLTLEGPPDAVARLALALSRRAALEPALEGIGVAALTLASPPTDAPDAPDPPEPVLAPSMPVDEAIARVLGGLAYAIALHAPAARAGDFEAVHRMRVATRRLRSALLVFRAPLGGSLDAIAARVAELAADLGRARDWDVFVVETGTEIVRGMGGDRRVAGLLEDAAARRLAAHERLAAHLGSPRARRLILELSLLACARGWRDGADAARRALLDDTLARFAPAIIERRFRRLVRGAPDLGALPADALHDRRKAAKKLRYAVEFLRSAWPPAKSRRLLRRLARAQARLGAINDIETGAGLVAQLRPAGAGAGSRPGEGGSFAAGAVCGFLAARGADARAGLARDWSRIRRQRRFWRPRAS